MAISHGTSSTQIVPYRNLIPILICLVLVIFPVIVFSPVKDCGFISLDDNMYVTENVHVQSGLNLNNIKKAFSFELVEISSNWHPLTWLSWMLDYSLFGLNPSGYHLVNLLLHILNTILLFLILRRMTRALWPSALVAALFAIHPLHVESVAWIAERKDVLSTFFMMLTLGAYSYYVEQRNFKRYAFVLLFFILGLMAKPMLVTLPFVLLLLDFWPLGRLSETQQVQKMQAEVAKPVSLDKPKKKPKKKGDVKEIREVKKPLEPEITVAPEFQWSRIYPLLLEKIPLFVLAALSSIVTYIAQQEGGAVSSAEMLSLASRIGNAIVSYITYIEKMSLPINLAVLYPHPGKVVLWQVFGAAVLLMSVTFVVIWKVKKFPYLATGWFWYVGTLVPVIGIVQVGAQALADRYTYIPLIGLFIMIAWGIPDLLNKVNCRKEMLWALSVLCILFLSLLTWRQVGYWKNSLILFDHTLKVTDNNWFAYKSRGNVYYDLGDYRSATADYDKALQITSRYAEAYNNRGTAYIKLGDYKQAIADLNRALEIKPAYADAYNGRCTVNHILGNYGQAIADCSRAIEIKPDYATAYNNRGNAYNALGNFKLAIENYSKAIEIKPVYAEAYYNRGSAFNSLGNYQRSIVDLNRAVEIKPDYPEAYINRGYAYKGLGNYSQAIENFGRAIEIKPDYAYAYLNRSAAYASLGKNDLAVQDLKMAAKFGDERARDVLKRKGINW